MELVPTPRPRRRRPSPLVLVSLLLFALAGLVLLPQALGLRHDLVRDPAMGSTWRGAVVLVDDVPGGDLRVGDVVTFAPPGRAGAARVTRRVTRVAGGVATTRADAATSRDPWRLRLDATFPRVVGRAPYVGRVVEGGPTTVAALVALALVTVAAVGLSRRRRVRRQVRRRAGSTPPIGVG